MRPEPEIWQENLEALQAVDAPLADLLANLPLPETVVPATGRDDHPNFRVCSAGDDAWFGRTSMPTVSAEGLLKQFHVGTGNVALPSIGSGLEAKLLSERLGRHRAIFVLETDSLRLGLALRLWDMAGAIRNHQIILLLASDLAGLQARLVEMCRANPGLEPPARMLAWPWRAKLDNQPWQNLLSEAAGQIHRQRREDLARQVQPSAKSADGPAESVTTRQAVAILTTMPGALTRQAVEALAEGGEALGLETVRCWPDNPLHAGPHAGLTVASELAASGAAVRIVLVDQGRHHWQLRDVTGPVVSWLVTPEQVGELYQPGTNVRDVAVATTSRQREQLLSQGWSAERVLDAPPFVSPKMFERTEEGSREGIVLVHDLMPEEADAAGVTLYSHKVLWRSLRERLRNEADAWRADEAMRWLHGAQATTGTDLADPTVQEQFAEMVRKCLAPSVILTRAARAIVEAGLPLRLFGRGWDALEWAKPMIEGPADEAGRRAEVLRRAKVAVLGDVRPGQAWLALEAAACGAAIVARGLWPESDPAGLLKADLEWYTWTGQQQLVERLRHLMRNDAAREKMTADARDRARTEHAADVRLRRVLAAE